MSAIFSLDNMISWLVQVSVIASLGALLPTLLRIRHPKSQLTYYHAILLLTLAFPFVAPWQHPLFVVSGYTVRTQPGPATSPWVGLILGVVSLGIVAKLFWLGIGLSQLRRFRRSAMPIYPIPQSVRDARIYTGADALFCVSKNVAGPATLGFFEPVVLLPASFLSLDEDAQRSVACHELMHVRRNDWLVTLLEEVAASLLWFHPVIWLLLAKARLTREQVVDAEVVRMNAPEPYIEALLSMAVVSKPRLAVPAAPFFTEGHLAARMRALLASPHRSWTRLCVSYACTVIALLVVCWVVLILVPLKGEAHVVTPPLQKQLQAFAHTRLRPPTLFASKFNVKLPAPAEPTRDVTYFVNVVTPDPAGTTPAEDVLTVPPPPPPPPPGPLFLLQGGVRALTREDLRHLRKFKASSPLFLSAPSFR